MLVGIFIIFITLVYFYTNVILQRFIVFCFSFVGYASLNNNKMPIYEVNNFI